MVEAQKRVSFCNNTNNTKLLLDKLFVVGRIARLTLRGIKKAQKGLEKKELLSSFSHNETMIIPFYYITVTVVGKGKHRTI
jgi:hypothetical protein